MKRKLLLSLLIGIVMSFIFSTALVANAATSKRQRGLRSDYWEEHISQPNVFHRATGSKPSWLNVKTIGTHLEVYQQANGEYVGSQIFIQNRYYNGDTLLHNNKDEQTVSGSNRAASDTRGVNLGKYTKIEQEARISGTRRYYTGNPAVYKETSFTETLLITVV